MHKQLTLVVLCTAILAGCGSGGERSKAQSREAAELQRQNAPDGFRGEERETIWDLFDSQEPEAGIAVNKYIWRAALETLSFLPPGIGRSILRYDDLRLGTSARFEQGLQGDGLRIGCGTGCSFAEGCHPDPARIGELGNRTRCRRRDTDSCTPAMAGRSGALDLKS